MTSTTARPHEDVLAARKRHKIISLGYLAAGFALIAFIANTQISGITDTLVGCTLEATRDVLPAGSDPTLTDGPVDCDYIDLNSPEPALPIGGGLALVAFGYSRYRRAIPHHRADRTIAYTLLAASVLTAGAVALPEPTYCGVVHNNTDPVFAFIGDCPTSWEPGWDTASTYIAR